jgi:hypothetical protein
MIVFWLSHVIRKEYRSIQFVAFAETVATAAIRNCATVIVWSFIIVTMNEMRVLESQNVILTNVCCQSTTKQRRKHVLEISRDRHGVAGSS